MNIKKVKYTYMRTSPYIRTHMQPPVRLLDAFCSSVT